MNLRHSHLLTAIKECWTTNGLSVYQWPCGSAHSRAFFGLGARARAELFGLNPQLKIHHFEELTFLDRDRYITGAGAVYIFDRYPSSSRPSLGGTCSLK